MLKPAETGAHVCRLMPSYFLSLKICRLKASNWWSWNPKIGFDKFKFGDAFLKWWRRRWQRRRQQRQRQRRRRRRRRRNCDDHNLSHHFRSTHSPNIILQISMNILSFAGWVHNCRSRSWRQRLHMCMCVPMWVHVCVWVCVRVGVGGCTSVHVCVRERVEWEERVMRRFDDQANFFRLYSDRLSILQGWLV